MGHIDDDTPAKWSRQLEARASTRNRQPSEMTPNEVISVANAMMSAAFEKNVRFVKWRVDGRRSEPVEAGRDEAAEQLLSGIKLIDGLQLLDEPDEQKRVDIMTTQVIKTAHHELVQLNRDSVDGYRRQITKAKPGESQNFNQQYGYADWQTAVSTALHEICASLAVASKAFADRDHHLVAEQIMNGLQGQEEFKKKIEANIAAISERAVSSVMNGPAGGLRA